MYKFGPIQKKILILLLGGVVLGLSSSPRQYFRTLRVMRKDWQRVSRQSFSRSIDRLADEKLVEERVSMDGSMTLVLTEQGKKQAKMLSLLAGSIKFKKPRRWDGRWRIVIFDIPEKDRIFRNILREHLRNLEFIKLQHSVFISPHPFEKQVLELTKIYSAQQYVRVITASRVDNEKAIKKHFSKKHNLT